MPPRLKLPPHCLVCHRSPANASSPASTATSSPRLERGMFASGHRARPQPSDEPSTHPIRSPHSVMNFSGLGPYSPRLRPYPAPDTEQCNAPTWQNHRSIEIEACRELADLPRQHGQLILHGGRSFIGPRPGFPIKQQQLHRAGIIQQGRVGEAHL